MSSTGKRARERAEARRANVRRLVIGAGIVIVMAGVVIFGVVLAPKPATGSAPLSGSPAGQSMPDTQMPKLGGGTIRMADYRGKPVVVNFWASWCPPCNMEAPLLGQAERAWRAKGVTFIGVDVEDQDAYGLQFLQKYHLGYVSGTDPNGDVSKAWGVNGYPETFFIGRDGRVRSVYPSAIDAATLQARIAAIAGH